MDKKHKAVVIGAGIGGLAAGIRLQALGFETTIVEALAGPGGRAAVRRHDGFTFDMGPTVITVPSFIEELFAQEVGLPALATPDFPATPSTIATERYCKIVPIAPFYRIIFDDGTVYDYDGDEAKTRRQIEALAPEDVAGFDRFQRDAKAIFDRGFLELGYTHFGDIRSMVRVAPDLLRLDALRTLFGFVSKYFRSEKMRQIFSFETLLIGGSPLRVPAIYAMIHFVEKTWGVHYVMGGTGALVDAFVRKFEELGGTMCYGSPVARIAVETAPGGPARRRNKRRATGVQFATNEFLAADLVVSNADYMHTYGELLTAGERGVAESLRMRTARQSMSLAVIYFGFRARADDATRLRHHNVILGPRYEELLREIFDRKTLGVDFSQYLHLPTLTDPSLAPAGMHAAYTLIPVPNNASGLDWQAIGPQFVEKVLHFLDARSYIPDLGARLVTKSFVTPDYFQTTLRSALGNAFGHEPLLTQSAAFRPHNRAGAIDGVYLAGANAQPGAGTPSVMMSAKMTARLVAEDYAIATQP